MIGADTRAYEAERRRIFHRRATLASILGAVLVPLFGSTDYFNYREHFTTLLAVRLISGIMSVLVFLLLRRSFGRKHPAALATVLGLEVGLAIAAVPVAVTGADTPYVSMSLLILSLAALLPWTAARFAFVSATLTATFVVGALLHGVTGTEEFGTQVSAVLVTGGIGLVITILSEKMREREFAARRALRAASREKTKLIRNLEQKTGELAAANRRLATLNEEMEDFLYVASHDLRAPLINVEGFAHEVTLGLSDLQPYANGAPEAQAVFSDIEDSVRFIHSATTRMDGLIRGLLSLSRIAARTNATESVDLQRVVAEIVESFRYQLDQHHIRLEVGALPTVRGDALQLNQIFSNLIDNAIKYMGESRSRIIEIGTRNGDGAPAFYVKDTGPGIPAQSRETVFRLFRRLESDVPGEGLGLAMVRKIVEKHGGRIWVESDPGQGSTFWFTLPGPGREDVTGPRGEANY